MMEGKKRKRGGCPKQDEKRESATGIRFTKSEYFKLKEKADKAGIGITTYIRKVALEGKVIARTNEEERHFYRQLSGISENLNQLTKKAHQEGILIAVFLFEKYRDKLERLPHCKNLDDLKNKLQKKGIETLYKYKGQTQELQGISFRIGKDRFKGSQIDRKFSLGSLQKTLASQRQ